MWTFIGYHGETKVWTTVDDLNSFINGGPDFEIEVYSKELGTFKTQKQFVVWVGDEER